MQPKTAYTIADLKKSSTERLIRIYERLTGRSAWDVYFNPYQERQMLICAIPHEHAMPAGYKPIKALVITVTPKGFSMVWTNEQVSTGKTQRRFSDDEIRLMRNLREDGESFRFIGEFFNLDPSNVSTICKRKRYAHVV